MLKTKFRGGVGGSESKINVLNFLPDIKLLTWSLMLGGSVKNEVKVYPTEFMWLDEKHQKKIFLEFLKNPTPLFMGSEVWPNIDMPYYDKMTF